MSIHDFIEYVNTRLNQNPYEGAWINDKGDSISVDVGYVYEWWYVCMAPELMRKFGEKSA